MHRKLSFGLRGADVEKLQRQLVKQGLSVPVTGFFGQETQRAVTLLQKRIGMELTGQVSRTLQEKLDKASPEALSHPTSEARRAKPFGVRLAACAGSRRSRAR